MTIPSQKRPPQSFAQADARATRPVSGPDLPFPALPEPKSGTCRGSFKFPSESARNRLDSLRITDYTPAHQQDAATALPAPR